MFCNIWFNSRIADTQSEIIKYIYKDLTVKSVGSCCIEMVSIKILDRITSSHYALLFRDIHLLQRKLYSYFLMSKSNVIILIENWNVFMKEELLGIFG